MSDQAKTLLAEVEAKCPDLVAFTLQKLTSGSSPVALRATLQCLSPVFA